VVRGASDVDASSYGAWLADEYDSIYGDAFDTKVRWPFWPT
jgi:hypothetical protein